VLRRKLERNDAENFLLQHAEPAHYDLLVEEEAVITKEDGSVLVRLVKDAVDPMDCEIAYRHLKSVDGALSARASVLGTKLVPRILSDGSKGKTMVVPPEVVARARQLGAKADFLGYKEAEPRYNFCRQTAWTREQPEVLQAAMPLIRAADCIFKIEFPAEWESQHNYVSKATDFRIGDTAFSTLTVNKNLPTTYHRDSGDYLQGFGVMLTLGSFTGGYLCFPAYRVAFSRECGLKVLCVNARCGTLRPSHRRSLRAVHLNELGLGRASRQCEQARTLGDSLGPHLRSLRGFLCFLGDLSFLRFHFCVPPWNAVHHSLIVINK
jgi:hypothetical protein